jgi:hypothetical protein
MDKSQLKWQGDIIESFRFTDKGVNEQPLLLVVYLLFSLCAGFIAGFESWAKLAGQAVLLAVACLVVRQAWSDLLDEDSRKNFQISHSGIPLLSLIFLQAMFYAPIALPVSFLILLLKSMSLTQNSALIAIAIVIIPPGVWWSLKSALAIVLVCIEDRGAVAALRESHRLMDKKFWLSFRYLAPVFLSLFLPMCMLWSALHVGYDLLWQQGVSMPVSIAALAIKALVEGASYFAVQLSMVACLTKLYEVAKNSDASVQKDVPL